MLRQWGVHDGAYQGKRLSRIVSAFADSTTSASSLPPPPSEAVEAGVLHRDRPGQMPLSNCGTLRSRAMARLVRYCAEMHPAVRGGDRPPLPLALVAEAVRPYGASRVSATRCNQDYRDAAASAPDRLAAQSGRARWVRGWTAQATRCPQNRRPARAELEERYDACRHRHEDGRHDFMNFPRFSATMPAKCARRAEQSRRRNLGALRSRLAEVEREAG